MPESTGYASHPAVTVAWHPFKEVQPREKAWYLVITNNRTAPIVRRWYGNMRHEDGTQKPLGWQNVLYWLGPLPSPPMDPKLVDVASLERMRRLDEESE